MLKFNISLYDIRIVSENLVNKKYFKSQDKSA